MDGHLVLGGRHPEVDHGHLALRGPGLVPPPARPRPGQLELRQREDPVKQTAGLLLGRRGSLLQTRGSIVYRLVSSVYSALSTQIPLIHAGVVSILLNCKAVKQLKSNTHGEIQFCARVTPARSAQHGGPHLVVRHAADGLLQLRRVLHQLRRHGQLLGSRGRSCGPRRGLLLHQPRRLRDLVIAGVLSPQLPAWKYLLRKTKILGQ